MRKRSKKNSSVIESVEDTRGKKQKNLSLHDLKVIKPMTEAQSQMMESYFQGYSILATGSAGTGKAQPLDSLVRIPGGWKRIGDIRRDDVISCPDGTYAKVNGVFPQGEKKTLTIIFEDGRRVECCEEHLWHLKTYRNSDPVILTAKELKEKFDTLSPKYFNSFKVPLIEHEETKNASVPLCPYVLGLLLGDGSFRNGISYTTTDSILLEHIKNILPDGYILREDADSITYSLQKENRNSYVPNVFIEMFKNWGLFDKLSHEKFIPDEYMKGLSKEQKHSLLAGLIDSDGEIDKNGNMYFHTTSYQLAKDFIEILRSLGGIGYLKEKNTFYTYKGEHKEGRKSYSIRVRYREVHNLTKLKRKKVNLSVNSQYKNWGLKIIDIFESGKKECVCISVDHPMHLYITNDYVVTHNTLVGLYLALNDLLNKNCEIDKIKIVRSVVASRDIGFLPGDLEEKVEVYETPYREQFSFLFDMPTSYDKFKSFGTVEFMSTSFLRGQTWDNTVVVVDEVQNLNFHEINTVMTRIGVNSKVLLLGDSNQTDLYKSKWDSSGIDILEKALEGNPFFDTIHFTKHDIVRSEFVKAWICGVEDT